VDNLTHTLFALTLARTPLGRGGRGTTAALVIASNAPDIDFVVNFVPATDYLVWHRGPTHGPLGVVGLGIVSAALVWVGRALANPARTNPAVAGSHANSIGSATSIVGSASMGSASIVGSGFSRIAADDAPFGRLIVISMIGVLLHVLLDLPTSYGTRFLSPFSWRWYALDLMPIIDIYLWAILACGLLVGSLRPSARGRAAAVALMLMTANYGIRAVAHERALAAAAEQYGGTLPRPCDPSAAFGGLLDSWPKARTSGEGGAPCLIDTAALPSFLSPFEWRVIARLPAEYLEIEGDQAATVPNRWTPLAVEASRTRRAQVLLGFSRFPVVRVLEESSGASTVQFTDLRFVANLGSPWLQGRRTALFTASVTFEH
jgi:membrane-bound metal-dependent hydrolase YbcI (DUF457 family)